ncbi:MAG: hypothetical protein OXI83_02395 [Gemmatimonadota bacterium]|nr:hypothetical protein [Gemmatimonadota bacterium]
MNRPTRIACAAGPLAALLAAVACATTPAGPPPFDPAGSYEYTAVVEGQPLSGTMTIEEAEEGYEGTILSAAFPPIPITSVTVEGQAGTIEAAGPGGPLIVEFTVTDDMIQGMWSMGLEGGDFTATKTG